MANTKWAPAKSIKFTDDESDLLETVREFTYGEFGQTLVIKDPAVKHAVNWWLTSPDSPPISGDWSKVPTDRIEGIKRVVLARTQP